MFMSVHKASDVSLRFETLTLKRLAHVSVCLGRHQHHLLPLPLCDMGTCYSHAVDLDSPNFPEDCNMRLSGILRRVDRSVEQHTYEAMRIPWYVHY